MNEISFNAATENFCSGLTEKDKTYSEIFILKTQDTS